MKVADSSVTFSTAYLFQEYRQTELSVTAWRDGARGSGSPAQGPPEAAPGATGRDRVEISREARDSLENQPVASEEPEMKCDGDVKAQIIRLLIEKMTGRRMRTVSMKDLGHGREPGEHCGKKHRTERPRERQREGWGVAVDYYERHGETEATAFHSEGIINTADGKQIRFQVDLTMTRQFMEENSLQIRMGDALKDPLVINFGGNAAQLTEAEFLFDLDADGTQESVSSLQSGSGFLALDLNGDGVVNNGSELFGPSTGNGFAELADHDEDGNGWIDENDSIYDRLRIWTRDEEGRDSLVGLGQAGVGAIYLENADTPFALKDMTNQLLGQIRSTGIYLNEDGTAGTLQQINIAL